MPRRDMRNPARPEPKPGQNAVNPLAISVAEAAKLLGVSEAALRRHIEAGAPVGANDMLNLVQYAAWLNLESEAALGA